MITLARGFGRLAAALVVALPLAFAATAQTAIDESAPPPPRPDAASAADATLPGPADPVEADVTPSGSGTTPNAEPLSFSTPPRPRPAALAEVRIEAALASLTTSRPRPRPADLAERAERIVAARRAAEESRRNVPVASTPTSAEIEAQATTPSAIPRGEMALIGVFGTPDARRALLRLSDGQFVRVGVGGEVDGWRVIAIGTDEIRLLRGGQTRVYELP